MRDSINIKYNSGTLEINLNELFYYQEEKICSDIIHYSKLQRVTKLFEFLDKERWRNEQSVEYCLKFLNLERQLWDKLQNKAQENIKCFKVGSVNYLKYKREWNSYNKILKLFDTATRILEEGR